jgi:hypothetical protein
MPGEALLERRLAATLGVGIRVALASRPIPLGGLSPREGARARRLAGTPRLRPWLLGRAALKRLLLLAGASEDTSALEFPHPWLSLTHGGDLAVAVAAPAARLRGIGVDYECLRECLRERRRPVDPRAARFFLGPAEEAWVTGLPAPAREPALLRLWTVKEAVFKADPRNRDRGLADYLLDGSPASAAGRVGSIRYRTLRLGDGVLTVAINGGAPDGG